jgi:hypothetical protein
VVNRLRQRFGLRRVSVVADRGMISASTIAALESEELDCDYILGARMRSVKEVTIQNRRYVVCLNKEQRRKDAADRQAIVEHLRE